MSMGSERDLTVVSHHVSASDRCQRYGHPGGVVWLTGLSGAGKSTLAMGLEATLLARGYATYTLDGDNIRNGLNGDLGFLPAERAENIRRVGEVAALFAHAGLICITAFISPYRADRALARHAARDTRFHEIHLAADLATCEARDPKGLYRKARSGVLRDFTGIDAPYEAPEHPELLLSTHGESVEESLNRLATYVCDALPIRKPFQIGCHPHS